MKINKWTFGLAAAGLVSLTPFAFNAGKQDGFNLDVMDLKISKPLEEGQWSAGYTFEVNYGPDATIIDGAGTAPIRQAYVTLRVPVGNGLDFQIGRFDNILGYETSDAMNNPNWTRSWAYTLEPTEHTGLLASYQAGSSLKLQAGVVDTISTGAVNARNANGAGFTTIESSKGIISLITLTAPDSWGFLKGSSLYGGADYGPGFGVNHAVTHFVDKVEVYAGATVNTPVKDLTFGAAYDSVEGEDLSGLAGYAMAASGYINYKITDKLSINGRGEYTHGTTYLGYLSGPAAGLGGPPSKDPKIIGVTGTLQYDLWANVISRLEVRWDHAADGTDHFGGTVFGAATKRNDVLIAANVIYKF